MKFGEQEFESILAFSRNREGQYTGQWISFFGMNELKDVKFEDRKLTFKRVIEREGNRMEMTFEGKIAESKLSGELKTSRGTWKVTGTRRTFRRPVSRQR